MNSTAAPRLPTREGTTALFGLCGWTSEEATCYGTVIPIAIVLVILVAVLARQLLITPQQAALQSVIQPRDSPLLPQTFRGLDSGELVRLLAGVSELPLKTFLPRIGLGNLVEPSATLGIANVKDLLRANRLALRDIGIGPKESRLFARALERRVRLRAKMQEVFANPAGGRSSSPTNNNNAAKRKSMAADARTSAAAPRGPRTSEPGTPRVGHA